MLYHSILGAPDSSGFGFSNLTLIYRSTIRSNNSDPVSYAAYVILWHSIPVTCGMVSNHQAPGATRSDRGGQRGQPDRHTRQCPSVLKPVPRFLCIIMLYILFASVYAFCYGTVMDRAYLCNWGLGLWV